MKTPVSRDELLRLPEVLTHTTFKKCHIYNLISRGEFPAPVKIGKRAVAWSKNEVLGWVEQTLKNRQIQNINKAPLKTRNSSSSGASL